MSGAIDARGWKNACVGTQRARVYGTLSCRDTSVLPRFPGSKPAGVQLLVRDNARDIPNEPLDPHNAQRRRLPRLTKYSVFARSFTISGTSAKTIRNTSTYESPVVNFHNMMSCIVGLGAFCTPIAIVSKSSVSRRVGALESAT